ncbi:uncharacterized protein TNCV_3407581 [Trichonephila clavipes]|uniref:Uncharacterized protein n=1 Tax=Trichonephila clavipes TaxID=2585209 RepID=A0A8X6RD65_TRICX|nr:uncharacterized protein TNCV_3407581 [Trichonephila clavipes]
MRDSSVKTTLFRSAPHILLSSHYWRRRRLWFCVKGTTSNGRLTGRPLCCKRRRMQQSNSIVHGTTLNECVVWWASKAALVMGAAILNAIQRGTLILFEKTQGSLVKVLSLTGWRQIKQLALRVHFLRWGGLLDEWSVEGFLSLVFV